MPARLNERDPMTKSALLALAAALSLTMTTARASNSRVRIASSRPSPQAPVGPEEKDQTLHAMHDEMARARARLSLPDVGPPFYIEYRILDIDVKSVSATFGDIISSSTTRGRFMSVDVRAGDYHLDSSNFISDNEFQGFLGSTGQVGIDRDYNSLRQDLWLATDQAYKAAATQLALKQAFLRSLTKPPEIDDFAKATPLVKIEPRMEPDWTSRNWDVEARAASAVLKGSGDLSGTRVNYYMVYATMYVMNSEGITIRKSQSLAGIEAAMDSTADDGMPLHNFYTAYASKPAGLPDPATVSKGLNLAASQLMALRISPLVSDYTGPVLFTAPAAAEALSQLLPASVVGDRPPLSAVSQFDQMMERMGGRSEWTGRVGTRVFPNTVSLVDDPTTPSFQGQSLLGSYAVDDEGVPSQRVALVENGVLRNLLMSRRPGPDFQASNGHARSALLSDTKPLISNLVLQSSDAVSAADMQKKFIDACKQDGHEWCIEIKQMDNPAVSSVHQEDFSEFLQEIGGGISAGERMPLMIYRVYVADGHEELVRGGVIEGLTLRSLRNIEAVGSESAVYDYMQNPQDGFAGTALGGFGSIQGGIPTSIVAPSLLLDELEIRGFHGEPRRLPIVPAPALK
jgi:predicted Zn-dependent protease